MFPSHPIPPPLVVLADPPRGCLWFWGGGGGNREPLVDWTHPSASLPGGGTGQVAGHGRTVLGQETTSQRWFPDPQPGEVRRASWSRCRRRRFWKGCWYFKMQQVCRHRAHLGTWEQLTQRQGVPLCVCEGECQEMDGAGGTAGPLLKALASWLGDALWGV